MEFSTTRAISVFSVSFSVMLTRQVDAALHYGIVPHCTLKITLSADASSTITEWKNRWRSMDTQHNISALWESLTAEYIFIKIKTVPLHGERSK